LPKMRFLFSILGVLVLTGSLFSPYMEGISSVSTFREFPSAQAANVEDTNIYIPYATVRHPVDSIFGVGMNSISLAGGLEAVVQTHSSWIRKDGVRWNEVEAVKGVRNWAVLDDLNTELLAAARARQRVVLIVQGTPAWAAKDYHTTCGPIKEDELETFASFLRDVVTIYSGYPYYVKNWEIWNEPDTDALESVDGFGCWGDATDEYFGGGYYAQMLTKVYPAIKSVDPASRVLVGGLLLDCDPVLCLTPAQSDKPAKFLEGILAAGGGNYFDGISFHAYDYYYGNGSYGNSNWDTKRSTNGPVLIAKAAYIRGLLDKYGVSGKFLMNTESALICDNGCDDTFETAKANYVPQAYAAAAAQGFEGNLWYNVFGWRYSGLLQNNLAPRDAYWTFKFASEKLGGATYSAKYVDDNLDGYEFRKGNRRILVLWSKDGQSYAHNLTPVNMYDAFGTPISGVLEVGSSPVYIELNL
jgi:hypothetical protein